MNNNICSHFVLSLCEFLRGIIWLHLMGGIEHALLAGGEEDEQQREQGAGHRLQRLQAHFLRLPVPG